MTDRLDAIRQRIAAATPGPWNLDYCERGGFVVIATAQGKHVVIASRNDIPHLTEQFSANAHLIAHAPDDLAYLLGEVERLSRGCDTCRRNEYGECKKSAIECVQQDSWYSNETRMKECEVFGNRCGAWEKRDE